MHPLRDGGQRASAIDAEVEVQRWVADYAEESMTATTAMDSYTRRAIDGELNRWGKWVERHADYTGHPSINFLVAQLYGAGGGIAGHRILCLDMPDGIYATHMRVLRLTESEQEAVYLYFAVQVKEDGTLWTVTEKSRIYGIREESLRRRLARARYKILGVPVPEMLESRPVDLLSAVG
jgi:hypothetical protein